jgi:hypothetical protein
MTELRFLLDHSDVHVRMISGETIALLMEISQRQGNDDDDDEDEDKDEESSSASGFEYHGIDDLIARVKELSTGTFSPKVSLWQ